ncbi:expressed unknown protein [Seminavis robusta]|uniref:Uncharacterized protein n=1 Tax=Seminavis robusta TaxID=568900 RepID=A0A9N8ES52_9STRA|nr:expressed unknown protein [Seminavis robusta]|eukprot:Sro1543_g281210.1 n/a (342) ;mRNA; r:25145-26170
MKQFDDNAIRRRELFVLTIPSFGVDNEIHVMIRSAPPLWSKWMDAAADFKEKKRLAQRRRLKGLPDCGAVTEQRSKDSTVCSQPGSTNTATTACSSGALLARPSIIFDNQATGGLEGDLVGFSIIAKPGGLDEIVELSEQSELTVDSTDDDSNVDELEEKEEVAVTRTCAIEEAFVDDLKDLTERLDAAFRTGMSRLESFLDEYDLNPLVVDEERSFCFSRRSSSSSSVSDDGYSEIELQRQFKAAAAAASLFGSGTGSLATPNKKAIKDEDELPFRNFFEEFWYYYRPIIIDIQSRHTLRLETFLHFLHLHCVALPNGYLLPHVSVVLVGRGKFPSAAIS